MATLLPNQPRRRATTDLTQWQPIGIAEAAIRCCSAAMKPTGTVLTRRWPLPWPPAVVGLRLAVTSGRSAPPMLRYWEQVLVPVELARPAMLHRGQSHGTPIPVLLAQPGFGASSKQPSKFHLTCPTHEHRYTGFPCRKNHKLKACASKAARTRSQPSQPAGQTLTGAITRRRLYARLARSISSKHRLQDAGSSNPYTEDSPCQGRPPIGRPGQGLGSSRPRRTVARVRKMPLH